MVPVVGAVEVGAVPNVVVLPNGRIVDEFCKPAPKPSGCVAAGVDVDVPPVGVPNVNVEFKDEDDVAPAAGVLEEPNKNPVVAGAAVVVVPKARK